jgi:hypothetical protein
VIYLDVEDWEYPFGLNLFACAPNSTIREQAAVASFVAHAFEKIWSVGTDTPRLMQNIRAVTRTLIHNPITTIAEAPLLYAYEPVRRRLLSRVQNPQIHLFWEQYAQKSLRDREIYSESTLNKINAFLDEPMIRNILAQEATTVNWRESMDSGKIVLIKLSPQFEEASTLIGSIIIGQLLLTAFSRADTPEGERRPFHLYCDEFQRFATSDFATIISESRKFRIRPFLSNQSVEQLDSATRAAVAGAGMLICFRVSGQDAKTIARNFSTTPTRQVIGSEPVRAPVSDILGHLVSHGHTNPVVSAFTSDYLMPFETFLQQVRNDHRPFEFGSAECQTGHLLECRRILNDVLFAAMQSGCADGFVHPWALMALAGAANDGSSRVLHPHMKETLFSGARFLGFEDSANALGAAGFLDNEQTVNTILRRYKRERWWDTITECRIVYPGPAFIRLLRALRSVLAILAAEPVMVDTGQYQPRYALRTHADMENEIGNVLSSNLRNFEAKVKLLTQEYTIRTRPAPQVLSGQPLAERLAVIRRQMRERNYTRHYSAVDAEIRARFARYRGLTDVPPPYSGGNGAARSAPSEAGEARTSEASNPPPPPPGSSVSPRRQDS